VVGLVAWARRPANRMGPLLVLTGLALLARQLRYSDDPFLFTMFFILGDIGYALVALSALAYPFGRVTDRAERVLVVAGVTTVLLIPSSIAFFYGGTASLSGFGRLSRDSLINVSANPHLVE